MKTIIIYGLRRSGNHYLISTILQQFTNYVHINDTILSYEKYNRYKEIEKTVSQIDNDWTGFKDVDCVIISIENQLINNYELQLFNHIYDIHIMMLIRCPYSHFSSVWKVYNKDKTMLTYLIKLWKLYAEEFNNPESKNIIKVVYDEYVVNDRYIINTLQKLGINNININNDIEIPYQKSSFKTNEKQRQVYRTINNCNYKTDINFIKLVKDNDIATMWKSIKPQ